MNVFELSAVATPLVGAIGGAMGVKSTGTTSMLLGSGAGLLIGVAVYFGAIGGSGLLGRTLIKETAEPLCPLPW